MVFELRPNGGQDARPTFTYVSIRVLRWFQTRLAPRPPANTPATHRPLMNAPTHDPPPAPRAAPPPPPRVVRLPVLSWLVWVVFLAVLIHGLMQARVTPNRLFNGAQNLGSFLTQSFPPDLTRLGSASWSMLETLQMALVGVTAGVALSLPLALLAATNTSPFPLVRHLTRTAVAIMRTVPDLIWALIFVIAVGLGPLAGILAIMMDTIGFCGRFFSERIEETAPGPAQALTATGARKIDVIFGAIVPEAMPSFVATSLYAVEKAIRSAVVLGLVGAGGIGVELAAAMDLWRYDQACTIILLILLVVLAAEHLSTRIRQKMLAPSAP